VRLEAGDPSAPDRLTGHVVLDIEGEPTTFQITVPAGPLAPEDLLPVFQGLTDAVVAAAGRRVERQGETISCRAGCGACCRQLVPVSEAEARGLASLVAAAPEPRRSEVRSRFEAALASLESGGLLTRLESVTRNGGEDVVELGLDYFRRRIACPFLEQESCSIHADRPLSCREFLVTSPPEHCAAPRVETVRSVRLARTSLGLAAASRAVTHDGWIPLVTALRFAARSPPSARDRSGPEILREVIDGGRPGTRAANTLSTIHPPSARRPKRSRAGTR